MAGMTMHDVNALARLLQIVTLQQERALASFHRVDIKRRGVEAAIRALQARTPRVPAEIAEAQAVNRWQIWQQARLKSLEDELACIQVSWDDLRNKAQQAQARKQIVEEMISRNRIARDRAKARRAIWDQAVFTRPAAQCRR